ncbi:MAG: hypothetical protein F7C81_00210 [Desulfurococcales archaeon]|nr:hypothetical protein [Desulfurococcales archaeon]
MGRLHITMEVNVPKNVILAVAREVSSQFLLKRPEYKKWYKVRVTDDGIVNEVSAYGVRLRFYAKVEALDGNKSRVTLEAMWNDIMNILMLGFVKGLAKSGIDSVILQLLSMEYGYRWGLRAKG